MRLPLQDVLHGDKPQLTPRGEQQPAEFASEAMPILMENNWGNPKHVSPSRRPYCRVDRLRLAETVDQHQIRSRPVLGEYDEASLRIHGRI